MSYQIKKYLPMVSIHNSKVLRGTTARPPFGQKIVPIFSFFFVWAGRKKLQFFSGKFTLLWVILIMGLHLLKFSLPPVGTLY
jgi:hypothetical protein